MTASPALKAILGKTGLTDEQLRRAGVSVLEHQRPVIDSPQLSRSALDYAARGWLVIPLHTPTARGCSCGRADCTSVGKHPRTRNGSKDGSRDPDTIREWWRRWPDANVGIATGPASGLLVLDVDGAQGEQSLIDLAQRGFIVPDSYIVRTGSGGQHIYFAWPEGADIRNSARKIAPGLDIRGVGGLVVAEPSLGKSGRRYEVNESAILPAPCPEWLLSLIQEAQGPQERQSAPAAGAVASERLIPKGKGDPAKLTLAGSMLRTHQPFDVILAAVVALDKKCEHQRGEEECRHKVTEWAKRYARGESLADKESAIIRPDLVRLSTVEARDVDWLWNPFLPLGMLSMISGDPGSGKSYIAQNIAAEGSRGRLRDGRIVAPFSTLYLTVENPEHEVMRPRFDLLGGDPSRFYLLKGTSLTVDEEQMKGSVTLADVHILGMAIKETGARLVVVDPLQSFLGSGVDLHRSNETRPVLDGLGKLAEEQDCSILILRHLAKTGGGKAIHRGLGSIDLTGAVRSEMLAGALPDDPDSRALIHIKSNVGPLGRALGYAIDGEGRFSWTGESTITAFDLLASPEGPDRKLTEATQWLSEKLKAGSVEQREVREQAEAAGISYRTLQRAKVALRICSRKATFGGGWLWWLPATEPGSEAVQ
jgi:Bifunctional DNA primase/polymerase, N-terminal/AAA domain